MGGKKEVDFERGGGDEGQRLDWLGLVESETTARRAGPGRERERERLNIAA